MKLKRVLSALMVTAVAASSMAVMGVSAADTDGISLMPIVDEALPPDDLVNDITYSVQPDGSWVLTQQKADNFWPCLKMKSLKTVDVSKTPYLYYEVEATDKWNINVPIGNGDPISMGAILSANPTTDPDATGNQKGRIDLRQYVESDGKAKEIGEISYFVVGPKNATVTIKQLYIAGDLVNGEWPKLTTKTYFNPYVATVETDLFSKDASKWATVDVSDTDNKYGEGSNPALTIESSGNGLKLTVSSKLEAEAPRNWFPARLETNMTGVSISGKYLYYSFKATGKWNLNLVFGSDPDDVNNTIKLAPAIMQAKNPDLKVLYTLGVADGDNVKTFTYDQDGPAGAFIGRIDLEAYINTVVEKERLAANPISDGKVDLCAAIVWDIGNAGTTVEMDKLFLGNGGEQNTQPAYGGSAGGNSNGGNTNGGNSNGGNNGGNKTPSTGDVTYAYAAIVIMVAAAGAVVLFSRKAKN